MGYLRTNYRTRVGPVVLVYHSNDTATYLSGYGTAMIPCGLLCISANMCQLLVYRGDAFVVFNPQKSTG